jgi:hypothetical protein
LNELQLSPDYAANYSEGWRNFPSHTRLRTPGCYGYQVDGRTFSIVIVFQAVTNSPAREALTTSRKLKLKRGRSSARFTLLAPNPPQHTFTVAADIAPRDSKINIEIVTWYGQQLHVLRAADRSWCHLAAQRARCQLPFPALEAQRAGPWTVVVRKQSTPPATATVRVSFEPLSR